MTRYFNSFENVPNNKTFLVSNPHPINKPGDVLVSGLMSAVPEIPISDEVEGSFVS